MEQTIVKISLFEFAKNITGDLDPTSVRVINAESGEEINRFLFFGEGDFLPSVSFSQNDFFTDLAGFGVSKKIVQKLENSNFPGVI